ncbi:hypothetical protein GCM10029978_080180 [Actinoallomurus acanthiterrae]
MARAVATTRGASVLGLGPESRGTTDTAAMTSPAPPRTGAATVLPGPSQGPLTPVRRTSASARRRPVAGLWRAR